MLSTSLMAAPTDYDYKLLEIKETKNDSNVVISVTIKVQCSKDSDLYIYPQVLDDKQFSLYKADVNNIKVICEDLFAIARARLDIQIDQKAKETKYSEAQKDAVVIDKVSIDTKAQAIKNDQEAILK